MNTIVKVENLKKVYGTGEQAVNALNGVELNVERGEFVAIIGASGSGKSTLLNIIGGLDVPTSGKVIIGENELMLFSDEEMTVYRRRNIGFVFQQYNLIPVLNVYENVVLPIQLDGEAVDEKYIERILDVLGIGEKRNVFPNKLSGGQQQRVAIARALATKPALILADEPTGNLDAKTTTSVMELLNNISKEFGQTIIMITHNSDLIKYCDSVYVMKDGILETDCYTTGKQ